MTLPAWFELRSFSAFRLACLLAALSGGLRPEPVHAQSLTDTVLHTFDEGPVLNTAPTVSGSVLYGVTSGGGTNDLGSVYSMATDGGHFQVLHSFAGPSFDGSVPSGPPTVVGTQLFGVLGHGGAWNSGAIYTMKTDGTGFSLLYSFLGAPWEGSNPAGRLTLSGSTLYGATETGGNAGDHGTVYKLNIDGTGYTTLHHFDDTGETPGAVLLSGSMLYGTTATTPGGWGTIYRMNTDGTGFTTLHTFDVNTEGVQPQALTLVGTTLYGLTKGAGTIFSMNLDGTGFSILHSFPGSGTSSTDGTDPRDTLSYANGRLYGVTNRGGSAGDGTLFSINLDGSGYSVDYSFTGTPDGNGPTGLTISADESTLYGVTLAGGPGGQAGQGTVFSVAVPAPEPGTLGLVLCGIGMLGCRRRVVRDE